MVKFIHIFVHGLFAMEFLACQSYIKFCYKPENVMKFL
jgi:hypothetical protein